MRIVTWNVNSLRARLPRVLEFLEQHRPDVACLQETKVPAGMFPDADLALAGYHAINTSAGQWAGVALLARQGLALEDPSFGLPDDVAPDEARWCEATIEGVRFVSTYVPNGRTLDSPEFPRKLAFLDAAAARASALAQNGVPIVIAGDMNIAPADPDVYDPAAFVGGTHVTEEERGRLKTIMASGGGLVDAYRHLHPDDVQFTWWDYRAGHFHKGLGLRIDLYLVSAALAERATRCGIERDYRKGKKPSDHAPLVLEFE